MLIGFFFAISACFVWGLIFVIPEILIAYSPMEIVLGRYAFYGMWSTLLLFRKGLGSLRRYSTHAWMTAFIFALASHILFYIGIVIGIRYTSAPLTVLVLGMTPILIAFYGNWQTREVSFKSLIIPAVWIATGMILVNLAEIDWTFTTYSLQQYLLGLLGIIGSLISWSWYAVQNARFLKDHPEIASNEWATAIGVATFCWIVVLGTIFSLASDGINLAKLFTWSDSTLTFIAGVATLGIVCSWMGCFLWNRASTYLPVSLMGPFLIFETVFGLIFVFLYAFRFPTFMEILGVISMLSGILLSIYLFRKQRKEMEVEEIPDIEGDS